MDVNTKIDMVLESVDPKNEKSVRQAANAILDDSHVKAGQTVAVIDDPTYSMSGQRVKVKSVDNGIATCVTEGGVELKLQVMLLIPV